MVDQDPPMTNIEKIMIEYLIKKIKRPYDPHSEKQHEFIASSGNLCKRYWDTSKEGLRTANAPWTITVREEKHDKQQFK